MLPIYQSNLLMCIWSRMKAIAIESTEQWTYWIIMSIDVCQRSFHSFAANIAHKHINFMKCIHKIFADGTASRRMWNRRRGSNADQKWNWNGQHPLLGPHMCTESPTVMSAFYSSWTSRSVILAIGINWFTMHYFIYGKLIQWIRSIVNAISAATSVIIHYYYMATSI